MTIKIGQHRIEVQHRVMRTRRNVRVRPTFPRAAVLDRDDVRVLAAGLCAVVVALATIGGAL